jgi:hypothetical protein
MVIIELLDFDLPVDLVLRTVLNGNGKVTSVVEASELTGWNRSLVESSGSWLLGRGLILRLVQADGFATETFSLLEDG